MRGRRPTPSSSAAGDRQPARRPGRVVVHQLFDRSARPTRPSTSSHPATRSSKDCWPTSRRTPKGAWHVSSRIPGPAAPGWSPYIGWSQFEVAPDSDGRARPDWAGHSCAGRWLRRRCRRTRPRRATGPRSWIHPAAGERRACRRGSGGQEHVRRDRSTAPLRRTPLGDTLLAHRKRCPAPPQLLPDTCCQWCGISAGRLSCQLARGSRADAVDTPLATAATERSRLAQWLRVENVGPQNRRSKPGGIPRAQVSSTTSSISKPLSGASRLGRGGTSPRTQLVNPYPTKIIGNRPAAALSASTSANWRECHARPSEVDQTGSEMPDPVRGTHPGGGSQPSGGGHGGMDGWVTCATTGRQVEGSSALGLKLTNAWMNGGSGPNDDGPVK